MPTSHSTEAVAVVGGGNMARALVGGWLAAGRLASDIHVADPSDVQRAALRTAFPAIRVHADNAAAVAQASAWILAVKPQDLRGVVRTLAPLARERRPLVVSVAAGVRAADLVRWLGAGVPVVRCMPNRPALLGAGMTALYAARGAGAGERALADRLLAAVGATVWLDAEEQMDAVTAVSGSGPAYFFLLVELLEAAAVEQGLAPAVARRLAVETARGAAVMAAVAGADPAELRAQVTSKGGTTAAALAVLEGAGLRAIVSRAVAAATTRSRELADESGRDLVDPPHA